MNEKVIVHGNIIKNKFKISENNENEILKPENISIEIGKLIAKERNLKKMTQKELAKKINENFHVINDYENGKAILNKNILSKMEKVLDIKLKGR